MRNWVAGAVLVLAFACGGSKSGDNGNGNGGGSNFTLTINVAGQGTVVATAQAVSCSSVCTQEIAPGSAVHLDASPAAGMQFMGWSGACSGTGGCDFSMTGDATVDANFAASTAQNLVTVAVSLVGNGTGRVTSAPAGIDCPGSCAMSVPVGTAITLSSTANAGSAFEGYGSGCSGTSCSFTSSVNATIYANFQNTVVPPVLHTLTVSVTGTGTVVSTPAGINCPGTCSAQFAAGADVGLTATAGASMELTAWTGACSGTGACAVMISADTSVGATFAADPCAGLMPSLGSAKTFTATKENANLLSCNAATTDGASNLYVRGAYVNTGDTSNTQWFGIFTAAGDVNDSPVDQTSFLGPVPLNSGFGTFTLTQSSAWLTYATFNADGSVKGAANAFPITDHFTASGYTVTGDAVVVSCYDNSGQNPAQYTFTTFDGDGTKTSVTFTDTRGCLGANVMVDEKGATLLVAVDISHNLQARWFDASAKPLTDWFQVFTNIGEASSLTLRPVIGGGAAMRIDHAWVGMIPNAQPHFSAVPAGFESGKDAEIVEGGKAYAMIPDANSVGTLDIVEPGGKVCGSLVTATNADTLSVGRDGTLIDLNACTASYYPHVLK
jgi:hypothetical protein